ncbi:MAG TPA: PhnD/SsuA/transferrin family substrate-binding protein, partial [Nitrosopumilaceae archaeon]|nr:PhnD/SsuA/transferrin family substrate-binding protein [Nitrosopumilaceae archaeon]
MHQKSIMIIALMIMATLIAVPITIDAESEIVPSWIKNTAGYWANNEISDVEFMNAIEYLIGQGAIQIPNLSEGVDVDTITIGFIPTEKAEELTPKAEEMKDFLKQKLGTNVEIVVPSNYETIIEGLRFGHIDAAFMDTG